MYDSMNINKSAEINYNEVGSYSLELGTIQVRNNTVLTECTLYSLLCPFYSIDGVYKRSGIIYKVGY